MSVASTRRESVRYDSSTAARAAMKESVTGTPARTLRSAEHFHRPNLDRSRLGAGNARRHLDGFVQVLRLDHVEPTQLLLGLGEWPVCGAELPVPDAHRGRGGRRHQ